MTIRLATIDEVEQLALLGLNFIRLTHYPTLDDATEETIGDLLMAVFGLEDDGAIFVADRDAEIVGGLVIVAAVHPLIRVRYADEIAWWVEPNHRGARLGPKLLRAAENWALAKGLKMIRMVAPVESHVGRFYERRGYRAIETTYVKVLHR